MTHAERDLLLAIARHLITPMLNGWDTREDRYCELSNAIGRVESERAHESQVSALLDIIIKARQLLLWGGAPAEGLSVRLHPSDYMSLGQGVGVGSEGRLIRFDFTNGELSVVGMLLSPARDIPIGSPLVEQVKNDVNPVS